MNRLATILLLGVLLFNLIGYRVFTFYMENKSNSQIEAQLDENKFDEAQLISIKVPVSHLSYYNVSAKFERVDGQIESDGIIYKYVKRRLYNDSLEVLCIPNKAAMQLNSAKNEFFRLVNDLQSNNQNKKSSSHKDFAKNFSTDNYDLQDDLVLNDFGISISKKSFLYAENLISSFSFIAEQPPDFIS